MQLGVGIYLFERSVTLEPASSKKLKQLRSSARELRGARVVSKRLARGLTKKSGWNQHALAGTGRAERQRQRRWALSLPRGSSCRLTLSRDQPGVDAP